MVSSVDKRKQDRLFYFIVHKKEIRCRLKCSYSVHLPEVSTACARAPFVTQSHRLFSLSPVEYRCTKISVLHTVKTVCE